MTTQFFNRIGQLGLGVALVGGVVNSALYNGKFNLIYLVPQISFQSSFCSYL